MSGFRAVLQKRRLRVTSFVILVVGIALTVWAFGGGPGWTDPLGPEMVALGLVYLVLFWKVQLRGGKRDRRPHPPGPATISIHRPATHVQGILRRYLILVDGRRAGRVGLGKTIEIPVLSGTRAVEALLDYAGSPVLQVQADPATPVHLIVEPSGSMFRAFGADADTGYLSLTLTSQPPRLIPAAPRPTDSA